MLKVLLVVGIVLGGVAGLPVFPYARKWGYTIPAVAMLLMFILIVLISLGALE